MKYVRLSEIAAQYGIDRNALEGLAREELIEIKYTLDEEPVVSNDDIDKARLAMMLMNELEVNLAGAEVIVHMREEMLAMQRQFGKILETLIEEIRQRVAANAFDMPSTRMVYSFSSGRKLTGLTCVVDPKVSIQ
jgi:MerR family transcriptional regulator/heat shock protein HspR